MVVILVRMYSCIRFIVKDCGFLHTAKFYLEIGCKHFTFRPIVSLFVLKRSTFRYTVISTQWHRRLYVVPKIHLWCNTCQPLDRQHGKTFEYSHSWHPIVQSIMSSFVFMLRVAWLVLRNPPLEQAPKLLIASIVGIRIYVSKARWCQLKRCLSWHAVQLQCIQVQTWCELGIKWNYTLKHVRIDRVWPVALYICMLLIAWIVLKNRPLEQHLPYLLIDSLMGWRSTSKVQRCQLKGVHFDMMEHKIETKQILCM